MVVSFIFHNENLFALRCGGILVLHSGLSGDGFHKCNDRLIDASFTQGWACLSPWNGRNSLWIYDRTRGKLIKH